MKIWQKFLLETHTQTRWICNHLRIWWQESVNEEMMILYTIFPRYSFARLATCHINNQINPKLISTLLRTKIKQQQHKTHFNWHMIARTLLFAISISFILDVHILFLYVLLMSIYILRLSREVLSIYSRMKWTPEGR
jgi:hypothetical protein